MGVALVCPQMKRTASAKYCDTVMDVAMAMLFLMPGFYFMGALMRHITPVPGAMRPIPPSSPILYVFYMLPGRAPPSNDTGLAFVLERRFAQSLLFLILPSV